MEKNLSLIVEVFHLTQSIKGQQEVSVIQIRNLDAKTYDLPTCGVKDGLRGTKVQETGNHVIQHQIC